MTSNRYPVRTFAAVAAAVFAWSLVLHGGAQPASPALPDVQKLGPQIGERAPDFTLVDQDGRSRSLGSLLGRRGLMLVFFRSADW